MIRFENTRHILRTLASYTEHTPLSDSSSGFLLESWHIVFRERSFYVNLIIHQ